MAKYITVNSGPHKDLQFPGHESVEDFDKQANQVGACLEEGDTSIVYRSTLPTAHEEFTKILHTNSKGIKRGSNEEATAAAQARADKAAALKGKPSVKVNPVDESYITFSNRVRGSVDDPEWKALDELVHEKAKTIAVDSSPGSRQKGPSKNALSKADDILGDSADSREKRISKLLNSVEGFELERDAENVPDKTSLARLIDAFFNQVEV